MRNRQNGNVVIFILLAVGLFSALAFTFTRGSQQSQGNMNEQQAKTAAQDIISFGNSLDRTINKLRGKGCSETQIDFYNTNWRFVNETLIHDLNHNPNAPATGCSVFASDDGGLQATIFPESYFGIFTLTGTNSKFGHGRVYRMGIPSVGTSPAEEMVYALGRLKESICQTINAQLAISNMPTFTTANTVNYDGGFATASQLTFTSNAPTDADMYCAKSDSNDTFNFYRVLIVR